MESSQDETQVLLSTPGNSSRRKVEGNQSKVQEDPICIRSSYCCKTTLVEPVIFLTFFSLISFGAIKIQFVYHSVAKEIDPNNSALHPDSIKSLCNVSNMSDIVQDEIQKRTAFYNLAFQLTYGIPNMVGGFLVGSLSDLYGRRLGMSIPIFGQSVAYSLLSAIIIFDLPLKCIFLTEFIAGICGNVFPVATAFLADATAESSRTFRMSTLDVGLFLTVGLGAFVYNEWLQTAGAIQSVMFIPILTLMAVAFLYVVCFLRETVPERGGGGNVVVGGGGRDFSRPHRPTPWESIKKCADIFKVENQTNDCSSLSYSSFPSSPSSSSSSSINVPFLLLFAVFLCAQLAYASQSLESLYLMNHPLCWEPRQLGYFAAMALAAYSIVTLFSTKFLVNFIGGDVGLLFLSLVSGVVAYVVLSMVRFSWMVWLYVAVGSFKVVCLPVLRSMMSKTVAASVFGSLYACVGVIESGVNLVVGSVFAVIYAQTLGWFPGFIFVLVAAFYLIGFFVVVVIKMQGRREEERRNRRTSEAYRVVDASEVET